MHLLSEYTDIYHNQEPQTDGMQADKKLNIGSGADVDILLDHPTVSRKHAEIWQEHANWVIRDLDSKNGTFINGRRIVQSFISKGDELKLGDYVADVETVFLKALDHFNKHRRDFSNEFAEMIPAFIRYERAKRKITRPPLLPLVLQIGFTAIIICILIFFPSLIPNPNTRYGLMVSVGLLSLILYRLLGSQSRKAERVDRLQADYDELLVCPKCKQPLLHKSLAYWKARKRCQNKNCDALYIAP